MIILIHWLGGLGFRGLGFHDKHPSVSKPITEIVTTAPLQHLPSTLSLCLECPSSKTLSFLANSYSSFKTRGSPLLSEKRRRLPDPWCYHSTSIISVLLLSCAVGLCKSVLH